MDSDGPSTILLRPSKKRKIYRQKARDDEDDNTTVQASDEQLSTVIGPSKEQSLEDLISTNGASIDGDEVEGTQVSMAEILRLRKRNKRLGGVEFKVENQKSRQDEGQALVLHEQEEGDVVVGGPRRFAPQTGTVGDVNKHM